MLSRKAGLTGFFLLCMAPFPSMAETASRLSRALNAQNSATKVLQGYCQHLYPGVKITAVALPTDQLIPPLPHHEFFILAKGETIRTRHVSLRCGDLALSDAWNWYVPQRLAPEMNRALETTNSPFGHIVAPLRFTRRPLESRSTDLPPGILLRNRAVLLRGDGLPFSLVEENYLVSGFSAFDALKP